MRKHGSHILRFILLSTLVASVGLGQVQTQKPSLTSVHVSVIDGNNRVVKGLTKEDLSLRIDGKEQVIEVLEEQTVVPFSIIAIDNSGSTRPILQLTIDSAKAIIRESDDGDLFALMRFVGRDKIQISDKFSNDEIYLNRLLDNFYIEGGQTALIDAMYRGGEVLKAQSNGPSDKRKTLVVISDGEDRDSINKEEQLISFLNEAGIRVCFLGLLFEMDKAITFLGTSPRKRSLDFIERVTSSTGGFAITPKKSDQLADAAKQLSIGLHSQLALRFRADAATKPNAKVELKLAKGSKHRDLRFFTPSKLPS